MQEKADFSNSLSWLITWWHYITPSNVLTTRHTHSSDYHCSADCPVVTRIPSEDPSGTSIILPPIEVSWLTTASRVLSKQQREAVEESLEQKKEALMVKAVLLYTPLTTGLRPQHVTLH